MTQEIAKDLQLFNLPKYATKIELKKQYHKFAKLTHPDILIGGKNSNMSDAQKAKIENKFAELTSAYERL